MAGTRVSSPTPTTPRVTATDDTGLASAYEASNAEYELVDSLGSGISGPLSVDAWDGFQYPSHASGAPFCGRLGELGCDCPRIESGHSDGQRLLILEPVGAGYWLRWAWPIEDGAFATGEGWFDLEDVRL